MFIIVPEQRFARKKIRKRVFWARVAPKTFSNESLSRCDQFYQIFVQIGANLAIFQPFEISIFFRNFERPFTPRNQLRSASNLAKTRFRRSPTFHFSTPKKNGLGLGCIPMLVSTMGCRCAASRCWFQQWAGVALYPVVGFQRNKHNNPGTIIKI